MKTLVILFSGLFATLTGQAQQDIAFVDVSTIKNETSIHSTKRRNVQYLDAVNFSSASNTISELQSEAANYSIKASSVFDDSEPATYDVNFRQGKNHVWVTYNGDGTILTSKEIYYNVPLPIKLRIDVSKRFSSWEFKETKSVITYDHKKGSHKTYSVVLKRGEETLTLTDLTII